MRPGTGRAPNFFQRAESNPGLTHLDSVMSGSPHALGAETRQTPELFHRRDRADQFIASFAHELRNPLAPLRTALDLFGLACPDDPLLQRAREVMERQLSHMSRLIDDLLDMSLLTSGNLRLKRERCDLARIVREALDEFRGDLEAHEVQLDTELPTRPAWLEGDRARLDQIVGNLLHEAVKHTHSGDRIRVQLLTRVTATGRHAELVVRDTGEPVAAALAAHLFDDFVPLNGERRGANPALYLARGLAELHGGRLRANVDASAQGLCTTLTLPLLPPAPELTQPQRRGGGTQGAPEPRGTPARGLRVVVIEDNPDVLETLRMAMTVHDHAVTEATTGREGLEAIRATRPDVVVCDIGLPGGMDGYAVARAVRADPAIRATRLIALTGYGQESDRQASAAAGFDLHLVKPVPFRELEAAMLGQATMH